MTHVRFEDEDFVEFRVGVRVHSGLNTVGGRVVGVATKMRRKRGKDVEGVVGAR